MIFGPSKKELRQQALNWELEARRVSESMNAYKDQTKLLEQELARAKAHINQLRNAVGTVGKQVNQCNDVMARTKVWTK